MGSNGFKFCLCCLALFGSVQSYADVVVNVPEDVNVEVVNLAKPELKGSLLGGERSLTLPNGVNQIVFQYTPQFVTRDDAKTVYSDFLITKFDANDTVISFKLPKYKSAQIAQEKIAHLKWSLIDNSGNELKTLSDKLDIDGIRLGRNYIEDATDYNKKGGIASVSMTFVTVDHQANEAGVSKKHIAELPANLPTLKKIYLQSSAQDRKAFRKWIVDQE